MKKIVTLVALLGIGLAFAGPVLAEEITIV